MAVLGRHHLQFLDADVQARFRTLHQLLFGLPLPDAEAALAAGRVVDAGTGQPVRWEPGVAVYPVSDRLRAQLRDRPDTGTPPRYQLVP
jgi:hypothetical protein